MRRAVLPLAALLGLVAAVPASAAFPGADGSIAFDSGRDGNSEIYKMNPDGTGQTRLTNNPASDTEASWSPDGNRLTFESNRTGNGEVFAMNANGGGQTDLTNNPATDGQGAWSPKGDQIAFFSARDGNNEIYRMNADGSGQTRLTNDPRNDFRPAWSPDGTKIAFTRTVAAANNEIVVMNADGSGQTQLTNNAASDRHPSWLPNGTQIVFARDNDIFRINADGTGETQIATDGAEPAASPTGERIAFRRTVPVVNTEIFVMNADGAGQTRLTNSAGSDSRPNWQPVNRTPTCQPQAATTTLNTAVVVDITCSDPDGNPLTYVTGAPGNGTLTGFAQVPQASGLSPFLQPPGLGRGTYKPNNNFLGADKINFLATDGRGGVTPVTPLDISVVFPPQDIPDVRSFSFAPKSVAAGKSGTFTYDLSRAGRVEIGVELQGKGRISRGKCKRRARRGKRCNLFTFKGTLTKDSVAGSNTLAFSGKFGSKALAAGSYLATITPFSATNQPGVPRTATFKVTGAKKN